MRKKIKNANKNGNSGNVHVLQKTTNFQKLHFLLHVLHFVFAFSWATVFGVALSGCIFHFNQVLQSLE